MAAKGIVEEDDGETSDLLKNREFTKEERKLLDEIKAEKEQGEG